MARMERFMKQEGRTVLIVGHNIRQLERICSRMILLRHGKVELDGEPSSVSKAFFDESTAPSTTLGSNTLIRPLVDSGEIEVRSAYVHSDRIDANRYVIPLFSDLDVELRVFCPEPVERLEIHFGIHNAEMVYVHKSSSLELGVAVNLPAGESVLRVCVPGLPLSPGPYGIGLGIYDWARRPIWAGSGLAEITVELPEKYTSVLPKSTLTYLPTKWDFTQSSSENAHGGTVLDFSRKVVKIDESTVTSQLHSNQ